MGKKRKPTRPKPTPPKKVREVKPDWDHLEWLDWMGILKGGIESPAKKH